MPENPLAVGPRFPPEVPVLGKALSHSARLRIIAGLERRPHRFTDLLELTGRTPGSLSPHLKQLQEAGIIRKVATLRREVVGEHYELAPFGQRCVEHIDQLFGPLVSHRRQQSSTSETTVTVGSGSAPLDLRSATAAKDIIRFEARV